MATKKTKAAPAKAAEQKPLGFPGDGGVKGPAAALAPAAAVPTVKMIRDPIYGGPTEADVHPDEVAGWQQHGWEIAE